ncbi:MAG: pyridoxal phosphate-dependent aminotransferase [Thermoplasmatales archaeon]
MVSSRFTLIQPSPTVSLNNKFSELIERGEKAISFAVGEPDATTPQHIIDFAAKKASEGGTHYTPSSGIRELREAIAMKYSTLTGKNIDFKNVIVTPAKFAINIAAQAVLNEGDKVLIQDPSFVSYPEIVRIAGGIPIYFPSRDDGSPDIEKLKELIDERTKMIFLNSPSNPHGWVASMDDLKAIADIARDHRIYVMADEIYEHIVYEGKHISILSLPGMEELTFVVNGFSKSHAMTGWRIGYLITPGNFSKVVDAYQQHTITCAPSISQYAALAALNDKRFPEEMKEKFRRRRDMLYDILSSSEKIIVKKPAGTFYMFPRILNGMSGEQFSSELLNRKKVLVTPGSGFGPSGKDRIRISYALSEDSMIEGAKRIVEFLG